MQIRQINLPVSQHLPETYGSYAPSRSCTFNDYFNFGSTFLSFFPPVFLSLRNLDLSALTSNQSGLITLFDLHLAYLINFISSSDVSFCKGCSGKSLTEGIVQIIFVLEPYLIWTGKYIVLLFSIYYICIVAFLHDGYGPFWIWIFVVFFCTILFHLWNMTLLAVL